ncbi:hypothetical protein LSTR_LSTR016707, partial [Laodelphax striatellus]
RFSDRLKSDAELDTKLGKSPVTDNLSVRLGNVRLGKDLSENRKSLGSDFGSRYQPCLDGAGKNRKSLEIRSDFGSKLPKSEGDADIKSLEIGSDFVSKIPKSVGIDGVSGFKNRQSLEVDGGKNRRSLEIDVDSKHLESVDVSDVGKAKDVRHDSIPFIDSVESVNFEEDPNSVLSADVSKSPSVLSPVVDKILKDSDRRLKVVEIDLDQLNESEFDVDVPPVSSKKDEQTSKLNVQQDTYVEMKPLTPEPEEMVQEPIYEEISGDASVHKKENVKIVEGVVESSSDDF